MSLFSMIFIGIANIEQPFLMHQPEMTERRERQKVHVCLFKRGYNSNRDCENSVQDERCSSMGDVFPAKMVPWDHGWATREQLLHLN